MTEGLVCFVCGALFGCIIGVAVVVANFAAIIVTEEPGEDEKRDDE